MILVGTFRENIVISFFRPQTKSKKERIIKGHRNILALLFLLSLLLCHIIYTTPHFLAAVAAAAARKENSVSRSRGAAV